MADQQMTMATNIISTSTLPPSSPILTAMYNTTSSSGSTTQGGVGGGEGPLTMQQYSMGQLMTTFAPAGVLAERIVPPVWYALGFPGNSLSCVIWFGARMRRNNSSAVYLGSLALSDLSFLLLHLLYNLHTAWGHAVYNVPGGCEPFMLFFYFPQYLSVVLVAAFTVERYVAVCHPFLKEKLCTVRRAFLVVLLCSLLSLLLSSAQTYIWTFHPRLDSCNFREGASRGHDRSFMNIWNWVVDMTVFVGVPLVVLVFNGLVLREILRLSRNGVISRQQSQGRGGGGGGGNSTASTLTLLSVSFFLIITQVTATVVSNLQGAFPTGDWELTGEEARQDPTWASLFTYVAARKIIEMACLSHYACYFCVYCLTGKHFRREVVYLLTCHGRLRCLDPCLRTPSGQRHRRGERYSMVSSNGHTLATDTCSTAFTTTM
ncbi:uncharacterized protein LOC143282540 [Babylonia areolata]|uniref:uncharacterized protein LOC143282540 n=1 Tax=Babylonia areolata TaxID=304850 RepID=UPI003FD1E2B5